MSASHTEYSSPIDGRAALGAVLLSLLLQAFAGWGEERRLVLRPTGHLSAFVTIAWAFTCVVSLTAIVLTRRWRMLAVLSGIVAALALAVLLS